MGIKAKTRIKSKKKFKQSEYDKLVTRKAKATLALREARHKLEEYEKTHTLR